MPTRHTHCQSCGKSTPGEFFACPVCFSEHVQSLTSQEVIERLESIIGTLNASCRRMNEENEKLKKVEAVTPERLAELKELYSKAPCGDIAAFQAGIFLQDRRIAEPFKEDFMKWFVAIHNAFPALLHSASQLHSLRSELATAKERIGELERMYQCVYCQTTEATIASQSEELEKRQWQDISTAPEEGLILVYMPDENESNRMHTAHFRKSTKVIGSRFDFDRKPASHWMPLPEPPTSHSTKAEGESHE